MKNAEAVASNIFLDPRRFWKEFKDAPEKCPISDVTKSYVLLAPERTGSFASRPHESGPYAPPP